MSFKQIPLTCHGHTRPVVYLGFSDITDSGYYIISACKDGKPMLRQGETGDWIGTFQGHKGAVWGVDLDSKALRAATGSADFEAKIWNAISGTEISSLSHKHIVKCVSFSQDDSKLVTGSYEKLARIFDLERLDAEPIKLSGHNGAIRQALFLDNDNLLITSSDDHSVRLWDLTTNEQIRKMVFPHVPSDIELSRDGTLLTVASDNTVSFYEIRNLDEDNLLRQHQMPTTVYSASLSPDKSIFICGGLDFKMYKYNFDDGTELDSFKGHFGPVHCIRFSPDGELYASGSEDGTLRLWQTNVGKTYGLWKCEDSAPTKSLSKQSANNDVDKYI